MRYTNLQLQSSGGVLKNVTKFTGKHMYQSLFFNKASGLQLYSKGESGTGVFL